MSSRRIFSASFNTQEHHEFSLPFDSQAKVMKLSDGKIAEYHEVANTAPGFVDMNFAPERIAKIAAKQGAALKARPEMKRHLEN